MKTISATLVALLLASSAYAQSPPVWYGPDNPLFGPASPGSSPPVGYRPPVFAGLNSPAFTGAPTAPTPASNDISNRLATTSFVNALLNNSPGQNPSAVAITGGNIDGTSIGNSTPAPGVFTTLSATGVLTLGTSGTAGIINSANSSQLLLFKDGPGGAVMLQIGGTTNDIIPQTDIQLKGGPWGSGILANGVAPIYQNATFTGTTTNASSGFGIWMQQTDNSSSTGNGNGTYGIYDNLILGNGSIGIRGGGYFSVDIRNTTSNTVAHDFTGVIGKCNMAVTDPVNGTYHSCFGGDTVAHVGAGFTINQIVSFEADTWSETNSVMTDRIGIQIVDVAGGGSSFGVQATRDDVALSLNNQYAPGPGLGYAIGIALPGRQGAFPGVATDGTLIAGVGHLGAGWTVAKGIDWSTGTATGNWLNMGGLFIVSQTGGVTAAGYKAGTAIGVSCNGATTGSFASVNGIVTHC